MRSLRRIGDNKFFLALALSVGFVAMFELGWRVANGWTRHWLDCHRYHPQLGWSLRENWAGRFSWTGGYSRINAQGIRDDYPVGLKAPDERRLLILGDSVTFGAKVLTHDAYPYRLQQALLSRGLRWRVLNGGVTAYDASQEAEWLELFGLHLEPDVVAVQFHPNDLNPSARHGRLEKTFVGPVGRWLSENSVLAYKTQRALLTLYAYALSALGHPSPATAKSEDLVGGWQSVEQAYRRIASVARGKNLPVMLIVFHTPDRLPDFEVDDLSPKLRSLAKELGWEILDLAPALRISSASLFLPSTHPSPAGHLRIARYVARELLQRDFLPKAARAG
jgi:lysophospholipase L1-like esterase